MDETENDCRDDECRCCCCTGDCRIDFHFELEDALFRGPAEGDYAAD